MHRYCVVGLGIIAVSGVDSCQWRVWLTGEKQACGVYYWVWIVFLPRIGRYEVVEKIEEQSNGVRNVRLVRRYYESDRQPLL